MRLNVRKIAHIINPVIVGESSDLFIAQPITFETMKIAREFARGQVDAALVTAQYTEDRSLVPDGFQITPDLERSVLDLDGFQEKRRLPLLEDILDRLYEAVPDAEYLIYTNVDIALMPHFYTTVNEIIESGYDAFVINRRTIPDRYRSIAEIPLMYAEIGEPHAGHDCFVFRRSVYPSYFLGSACIGGGRIGKVLLLNLICNAIEFKEFKDLHLTFHIGDARVSSSPKHRDYLLHNHNELKKVLNHYETERKLPDHPWVKRIMERYIDPIERQEQDRKSSFSIKQKPPRVKANVKNVIARLKNWSKKQQNQGLPERILILLTNPRSGSTWLFDALRCHPAIYVNASSVIYEYLGLTGRRYPRDLSGGPQATLSIETHPGQWERIPDFAVVNEGQTFVSTEVMQQPYAIEKCHPHFFEHDVPAFLRNIAELERNATVRLLYQVRDPKSSMISFLQYKKRNPPWNSHISQEQLPQHMRHIYDSILRVALERPGLVIDYKELMTDFHTAIARVFDYLWPGETCAMKGCNTELINLMALMTAREKRRAESTAFLGKRPGPISGDDGEYEHFFSDYVEEIDHCYQIYHSLLQLGSNRREESDR